MGKLNDTQQLWVVSGVSILLSLTAGFGVWWAKGLVEEQKIAIQDKQQRIAAAQVKIAKIPNTEKEVIILRENLDEYVKILPDSKDLNNFFRIANQFEAQSGVSIRALTPSNSAHGAGGSFSLVTYQMELKGSLWQFLEFMNFWEGWERFVKVTDFVLTSGAGSGRDRTSTGQEDGDVQHITRLTLETYQYNRGGRANEVVIPNYVNKRDNLKEDIFKRRQIIRLDTYEFKGSRGRRDIFVDPRQHRDEGEVSGIPIADQRKLIDRFSGEVAELQSLWKRIDQTGITIFDQYRLEKALRDGLKVVKKEVDQVEGKGLIKYLPYKLKWTNEVIQPLEDLVVKLDEIEDVGGDQWLTEKQFDELITGMRRHLENGDLEMARNRYDAVAGKVEVPRGHPAYARSVTAKGLHIRALRAIEFSNLALDIQGVVVTEGGKSGVLLNDTVLEEGDYVNDNLLVKAIGAEQITFVYKGFTLIKTW